MRQSSFQRIDIPLSRDIESKYDDIKVVADNIDTVTLSSANIDTFIGILDNISSILAVAGLEAEVEALSARTTEIDSLYADKAVLDSLFADKAKLDSLFADKAKLDSLFSDKAVLDSLYADKAKLDAVYADLVKIVTVADNIGDVNTVADNIADVNAVAATVVPNMAEILLADDNAAIATTKAAEASTSEANALAYMNTTSDMKDAVKAIYDTFDDRFLGTYTDDPTVDNDGNALLDGALYFNTSSDVLKVYNKTSLSWIAMPVSAISGSSDVNLTSLAADDILKYDGTNWINTKFDPSAYEPADEAIQAHLIDVDNPHSVTKAQVGLDQVDNTSDLDKPISTATQTALNGKLGRTENAVSASKLTTARTIGGVSFDGSTNIDLPGVNITGNQNTTGNSATTTKLQTPRTITLSGDVSGSTSFDGSANVTLSAQVANDSHSHSTSTITGLGTAATRDVGTSAGNVMEVGAFGVGASPKNGQIRSWVLPTFYFGEAGINDEYLVLFPSEVSGPHAIKGEFHGSRGSATSGNLSMVQFINAQSAYNSNSLSSWYKERARFIRFSILSIDGVSYVALKGDISGGYNHNQNVFYGNVIGGDARLFTRVRASDSNVTVVNDYIKTVDRIYHTGNIKTALNATGTAPIYACRAWVNFNGLGTVAIRASGNVSSITDFGEGVYRVNFATAMPDANYSAQASIGNSTGSIGGFYPIVRTDQLSTTSLAVRALVGTTYIDAEIVNVSIFR